MIRELKITNHIVRTFRSRRLSWKPKCTSRDRVQLSTNGNARRHVGPATTVPAFYVAFNLWQATHSDLRVPLVLFGPWGSYKEAVSSWCQPGSESPPLSRFLGRRPSALSTIAQGRDATDPQSPKGPGRVRTCGYHILWNVDVNEVVF